jgi:hypothetical protein
MEKYKNIYQIAEKLTKNEILRTFFIVYLMNEGTHRAAVESQFWRDMDALSVSEKNVLTNELRQSFFQLPHLIKEIRSETQALKLEVLPKAA